MIVSAISGVIIGVLALIRNKDYIINNLISRLIYVFLANRAYSIVAILFFNLSIANYYINKNFDFTEKIDLIEKRERKRRRLTKNKEAFILIMIIIYSAS